MYNEFGQCIINIRPRIFGHKNTLLEYLLPFFIGQFFQKTIPEILAR